MGVKPTVAYWNNIPSPYVVERFDAISARGNLDFEAWFSRSGAAHRSWHLDEASWAFRYRYMDQYVNGATPARMIRVARMVRCARPDVLVSLYDNSDFVSGITSARAFGSRVAIHVMKVFDTWRPRRRTREVAKRVLFPRVHAIHVPGPDAAAYARQYGARDEQLVMFPEPVNVAHFRRPDDHDGQRAAERHRLGLAGCVFLYVGRLWSPKGLSYLFDAYEGVRRAGIDASLLLVGDGLDEARYRARAAALPDVVFAGFVQERDLPRWYHLADVFVFPTLGDPYGHVVQEAMAAGLPVIATDHAGEISERVLDGVTGFIVQAASKVSLERRMVALADDAALRTRMGQSGFERIRPRTVEWWAAEFERLVDRTLSAAATEAQP